MTSMEVEMLASLLGSGFDTSYIRESGGCRVSCSQCAALCINGVATHEHGCPNANGQRHTLREECSYEDEFFGDVDAEDFCRGT